MFQEYTHIPLIYSKVDLILLVFNVEVEEKNYICAVTKALKIVYVSTWHYTYAYVEKICLCLSNVFYFLTHFHVCQSRILN